MNIPVASQTRLVIMGAMGMVGGYAIRYALDHPAVGRVTAIRHGWLMIETPLIRIKPVQ